ncbi:MAG: twin-arginine translocase subunit TatC [Bacteroidota bacterium]|jgi:sec-independent protein translocase protein TatC
MSEEQANSKPKKARANLEEEMSFFGHLASLRMHLVRSALVIVSVTALAFIYYDVIFNQIVMGPKNPSFWTYRMMCVLADKFSLGADFCIKEIPFNIINTEMAGQFTLQMNSSLIIGIVLGFPYLLWELWRFVKPALHENERKSASGFVFYASLLFVLGILFGYYIIAPLSVNFLANYTVSAYIVNNITIDSYLSTVATLTLGTGIIFELPIVIYILSKLGIMTPQFMRNSRRYATVIILIIAAIVTPTPDLFTMFTVSLPLFLLYEISIIVSGKVEKKRKAKEVEFYQN